MIEKRLGKIKSIYFGYSDRNDLGLHIEFEMQSSGVVGTYTVSTAKITEYSNCSESDRSENIINLFWRIDKLLKQAKVNSIEKLKKYSS